jgi:hypothetical protein
VERLPLAFPPNVVDLSHLLPDAVPLAVIPTEVGIQAVQCFWIPAFTGVMTWDEVTLLNSTALLCPPQIPATQITDLILEDSHPIMPEIKNR